MSANKKRRNSNEDISSNTDTSYSKQKKRPSSSILGISRSIAACKRCRLKKVKCDQKFPSCSKCASANEPCISLDPATGRDVPRSYVIFLEDRLEAMMKKLKECGINPLEVQGNIPATSEDMPCDFNLFEQKLRSEHELSDDNAMAGYIINNGTSMQKGVSIDESSTEKPWKSTNSTISNQTATSLELGESSKDLESLGAMKQNKKQKNSMGNASNSYLGDSSGIPFAKLMFTAVKFSPDAVEPDQEQESSVDTEFDEVSESFDPLYLPTKDEAEGLLFKYFAHSNSQLPVLHREFFLKKYFEPVYGPLTEGVSLASDHTVINREFKLPSIHQIEGNDETPWFETWSSNRNSDLKIPLRYHVPLFFLNIIFSIGESTRVLDSNAEKSRNFKKRAVHYIDTLYCSNDRLEALAGVLLIAIYSIMRPNVPGVWYIMGSALRLAVDLGLHAEKLNKNYDPFTRELRRRLFWCTYALDRQICVHFGRPFGIPDENITAKFPSTLDDALITTAADSIDDYSQVKSSMASYKVISLAIFKIRKIQTSIVQVLYAPNGRLPSHFTDLEKWRAVMDYELDNWYNKVTPKTHRKMNCEFKVELFQLNYCHSKIMLYGLSPKSLSLTSYGYEVVHDSSTNAINAYYKLCKEGNINYTWVAVHNLFMAGMSYLYTIYNSSKGSMETSDKFKEHSSKLLHVLKCLIGTCDAAKNCHKIFQVLSAAVTRLKFEDVEMKESGRIETAIPPEKKGGDDNRQTTETLTSDLSLNRNNNEISTVTQENALGDTLDQFFVELDKLSPFSETTRSQVSHSNFDSPETENGNTTSGTQQYINALSSTAQNTLGKIDETTPYPQLSNTVKENHKRADELDLSRKYPSTKDGQRVYDMIYQVSTEAVWDQFFSNLGGGNGDVGRQPDLF